MVLFILLPSTLQAEEFIVYQIQCKNFILKTIATQFIRNTTNNRIKITVKGDMAYISYKASQKSIEFHQATEKKDQYFYKKRKSHVAKLYIDEVNYCKEAYIILEENGKRKIKVSLIQI